MMSETKNCFFLLQKMKFGSCKLSKRKASNLNSNWVMFVCVPGIMSPGIMVKDFLYTIQLYNCPLIKKFGDFFCWFNFLFYRNQRDWRTKESSWTPTSRRWGCFWPFSIQYRQSKEGNCQKEGSWKGIYIFFAYLIVENFSLKILLMYFIWNRLFPSDFLHIVLAAQTRSRIEGERTSKRHRSQWIVQTIRRRSTPATERATATCQTSYSWRNSCIQGKI